MKHFVVIICLFPLISNAKKKKLQMAIASEKKANETLVSNLRNHVKYLADDKLEGRRAGTAGEKLAMQYIINQY